MKALIFLLLTPAWSAPVIDTDDGLKLHNHTDPYRSGKYFSNNEFVMGNVAVDGNVAGDQVSVGHDLSINIDHEMDHTGVDAAIDGGWSGWSVSSECSASCGAATRKWARTCTNPAPTNEGKSCEGNDEETRSCYRPSCELYPADNQGGVPLAIGVAFFAVSQIEFFYSAIKAYQRHEEVMNRLNEIKGITMSNQKGIYELQASMDFVSEQLQLDEAHTKIHTHVDRMSELKGINANKERWDDWAKAVLDVNVGTQWALSVIHSQIFRNLIEKFKNKASAAAGNNRLKRSVAGSVSDFFKYQVQDQIVGFQMVIEAYTQLKYCKRRDDEYKIMIERFNRQIALYKNIDASMPPINYLQNDNRENYGYFAMDDVKYIHLHGVDADEGHVVTGVQLYQLGNRIALKIKQGKLQGFGKIDSENWKDSSDKWGENRGHDYVSIDDECPYIDQNPVQVPDGSAIVGISFFQKGNRLSIKVKSAIVDYRNGKVYYDKYIWAPGWGERYDVDYFYTDDKYVDTNRVETRPSSMLTAAKLYLKMGNRMAFKVSDIFKPTAGRSVSCAPNSDVIMSKNYYKYQCCDGFPYAGEASQICPGDESGPIYETEDIECIEE